MSEFRLLTGDENGLLKYIHYKKKDLHTKVYGEQSRSLGIKGLDWLEKNKILSLIRSNGNLEIWKYNNDNNDNNNDNTDDEHENEFNIIHSKENIINNCIGCKTNDDENNVLCIGADGNIVILNTNISTSRYKYEEFEVDGPISAYHIRNNNIALGGRENDLKLYDIKTQKKIWSAKNVPDDKLLLRVPIWISAITHIDGNPNLIATGTAHKHLRVYDTTVNNSQPISTIDYSEEYHITSIASSKDGNGIFVGDNSGGLHHYDRRNLKRISTYHGYAGSIRDIDLTSDGRYVAAVGLDRFVRIFNTTGNKEEVSIFLRNRLNRVLFFHDERKSTKRLREYNDGDYDDKGNDDDSDIIEEYYEDDDDDDDEDNDDNEEEDGGLFAVFTVSSTEYL